MKCMFCLIMILLFASSAVLAENHEKRLTPVEKEAQTGGVVYYGMARDDLCELYMHFLDQEHWKDGGTEWITFSECPATGSINTVTFRLENGEVKDWYKGRRRP